MQVAVARAGPLIRATELRQDRLGVCRSRYAPRSNHSTSDMTTPPVGTG